MGLHCSAFFLLTLTLVPSCVPSDLPDTVSGLDRFLDDLAQDEVFGPLGMTRSSFLFDASMQVNASDGHDRELDPDKWSISLALASSSLYTTAVDLARFGIHLASGSAGAAIFQPLRNPQSRWVPVANGRSTGGLEWG